LLEVLLHEVRRLLCKRGGKSGIGLGPTLANNRIIEPQWRGPTNMGEESPLLLCKGLEVRRGLRTILKNVDLVVDEGEVVVLRGDNGCGKSTLLETAAGIRMLRKGTVFHRTAEGEIAIIRNSHGHREIVSPFGLTLQKLALCGDELVIERLELALKVAGFEPEDEEVQQLIQQTMERWGLEHRKNDRIAWLSGGLARRVSILAGLLPAIGAKKPTLFLLDEPDSGLDDKGIKILAKTISELSEKGHGALVATHNETIGDVATRTIVWENGNPNLTEVDYKVPTKKMSSTTKSIRLHTSTIRAESKWVSRLDRRTWGSFSSAGIAGLVALLLVLSFNLKMNEYTREWNTLLVFMPAMVIGLIPPQSLNWASENGGREWWDAMSAGNTPMGNPIQQRLIGGVITIIAIISFKYEWEVQIDSIAVYLLMVGLAILLVILNTNIVVAQRRLVNSLERSNALLFNLFLPLLIYPFILFTNGIAQFLGNVNPVLGDLQNTLAGIAIFYCIYLALRLLKPQ